MSRRHGRGGNSSPRMGRTSVSVRPGWGASAAPRPRQVRPRPPAPKGRAAARSCIAPALGETDPCLAHTSSLSTVRVRPPSCWINAVANDGAAATICVKSIADTTRKTTGVCAMTENGWSATTSASGPPITAPGPSARTGIRFASAPA